MRPPYPYDDGGREVVGTDLGLEIDLYYFLLRDL